MQSRSRFRRAAGLILFFSLSIALVVAVTLLSIYLPPADEHMQDVTVPSLVGTLYHTDDARLPAALYAVTLEYRTSDTVPAGTVMAQTPSGGSVRRVVPDEHPCEMHLVISAGAEVLMLPDLIGADAEDAVRRLREMGLHPQTQRQTAPHLAPGQILRTQPPAGATLHRGDTVHLFEATVASRRTLLVPQAEGLSLSAARDALTAKGFYTGEVIYAPSDQPTDTVIAQFPLGGTLVCAELRRVTLTLSDGSLQPTPEQLPLPQDDAPNADMPAPAPPEQTPDTPPDAANADRSPDDGEQSPRKKRRFPLFQGIG